MSKTTIAMFVALAIFAAALSVTLHAIFGNFGTLLGFVIALGLGSVVGTWRGHVDGGR